MLDVSHRPIQRLCFPPAHLPHLLVYQTVEASELNTRSYAKAKVSSVTCGHQSAFAALSPILKCKWPY